MGSRLEANSSAVRKKIEKHKFENEEGEEYESSKFGGFTDYFRRKKIKLQNLDAELRSSSSNNPPIFRGVVAHVNGYTQPSLNDLHHLIVSYGGGFLQYLDGKTTVTHIIASNLTPKKKVEFRRYRIVKPAWVVDSIKAGKLLPWDGYRVVDEGVGQNILGFENGSVISQTNSQNVGYRDQTDNSWYTRQVENVADELDNATRERPIASAQNHHDSNDNDEYDHKSFPEKRQNMPEVDVSMPAPPEPSANTYDSQAKERLGEHFEQRLSDDEEITPRSDLDTLIRDEKSIEGESEPFQTDEVSLETPQNFPNLKVQQATLESSSVKGEIVQPTKNDDAPNTTKKPEMTAEDHNAALLADPRVWKSTVVNPGFLKQYYEESRLHHLSTWKADLKSQLQALAAEKSSSQKSREKRAPGSRRYILHVDFDSFFAAVSLKKFPQYVDLPVVIAHGGGSGSEIASCNYPARKFGVKNGMWMKSAQKMCPDLKVLPYDFKAYEEASRNFYEAIMDTGGIVQSVSVDEALVDVSTICAAAGGHDGKGIQEGSIWREQAKADEISCGLREKIREKTGCAVSVGIGGNILLAKVALRRAKPAGQYHVKPEEALEFLGGLLVQDLPGVAHSIGGKLEEIGVKLVKDVRELSKERLMSALGPKTGEKIWDYSRGIDRGEVGEQVIRKSVSAEVNWGIRFVTHEQADEFVQSLCDELHKRLMNEKVKGRQLTMKIMRRAADAPLDPPKHLGHGKCDTFNKSIVLGVATNEKEVLGREAISIMRGWGFSPGELRGIGVQMTKLEPLKGSLEGPSLSSQKRLHFKTFDSPNHPTKQAESVEDLDSPRKPRAPPAHLAASLTTDISPSGKRRQPLNTLGTQFVLPTQVDPEVLAELPEDIISKIVPKKPDKLPFELGSNIPIARERSSSPVLPPDALPAQSQLDQETLDALPSDVRAEILAFYQTSPKKPPAQGLLTQSPRKIRPVRPLSKKTTTPTKRRGGLLTRGRNVSKSTWGSTLTQSNFVANRALDSSADDAAPGPTSEVSPEFLAALPEDIRREVLDQARRDRLKTRGGIDLVGKRPNKPNRPAQPPPGQRFLRLPPRPAPPTFTAQRLSALPDLRDAISAWFEEFKAEGPYSDDVDALVGYLQKVIGEEGDMGKAVSVAKWLGWVIDEAEGVEKGRAEWTGALARVEEGVQEAVRERGLGAVVF